MRDAEPKAIHLADYRPPDWLVDKVELDFALHPSQSRVTARLALRRNPEGTTGAPVVLEGDGLTLVRLAIDGKPLAGSSFEASPARLTLALSLIHI